MPKWTFWLLIITLLLLSAGPPSATSAASRPVTLGMTYVPNVQFAPWYVAQTKGFFKSEGLAVRFDYRMDIDALQLAAAGQMDFAVAGGDQAIIARSQGIPVTYLINLYAKFPLAIIAKDDSGIRSPRELRGKKIGLPLYGTNLLGIKAVLKQAGINESEVRLIDIGYTQIVSLTEGRVDAVVGFANNESVKLQATGQPVTVIPVWNYLSLPGHGLIAGDPVLRRSPALVRKMVRATLKGMRYCLDHPDEAFDICLKFLPEAGAEQRKIERRVLTESLKLWENDYTRKHGLGRSDPSVWEDSQQLMLELGLIKRATPVEQLMRQDFIPR